MIARLVITLIAIPVLIYAFASRFIMEMGNAAKFAWWEAGSELHSIKRAWRAKSIRPEKW